MFKSPVSAQADPFHDSVVATLAGADVSPPINKAFVLLDPDPPAPSLDTFKSATSVQDEPFQDSVLA